VLSSRTTCAAVRTHPSEEIKNPEPTPFPVAMATIAGEKSLQAVFNVMGFRVCAIADKEKNRTARETLALGIRLSGVKGAAGLYA
jgi:hypothetical protein